MIRKFTVCFHLVFLAFFELAAQQPNSFVPVNGTVINQADSSALPSVTVYYEKLPYYDDMGMTKSAADGTFQFDMAEGVSYNFRVEGVSGFEPFEEQVTIMANESGQMSLQLKVLPIEPEELEELIRLDNLNFNRGSATILTSSYQSLDDFIIYINERPEVKIQLEGHTDFAGNPEANMRLSQARVESVAEYLSSNGVKKNRITTKAFGGSQPISEERTDEAKRINRRVEVRLIRQGS